MHRLRTIIGCLFFLCLTGFCFPEENQIPDNQKYWVFFKDKGTNEILQKNGFEAGLELDLSHRALFRRAKIRRENELVDVTDLPVVQEYIRRLETLGLKCQVVSRWLNGVSVVIPQSLFNQVLSLPFVRKIQPVISLYDTPPSGTIEKNKSFFPLKSHVLDYGNSYTQNQLIHVPEVHDLGITGAGVLVGIIDSGFDYQGRSVFSHIDVMAEHDFYWNDSVTANEADDPLQQHDHGTEVFSIIGGFHEGYLIGPAYEATFALAKTEWVPTETRVEEDYWVAGIEWLENLGVDVVSSSLGYGKFNDGSGYTFTDLDGNTCVITIAADIAASKGVVVVNAAGNRDFSIYINAPADGDSVIAVGAVTSNGNLAYMSSVGPTADGRIKPDVVAMGIGVTAVNPSRNVQSYLSVNGTSASCPLVAGVCAMVLQAHPELGPMEVREAIRETASQNESPDNFMGWGLVNAYEAIFYHGMIFMNFKKGSLPVEDLVSIEVDLLSRSGVEPDSVFMFYREAEMDDFQWIQLEKMSGSRTQTYRTLLPCSIDWENLKFYLSAVDTLGIRFVGPYGAPQLLYSFSDTSAVVIKTETPNTFYLYQNYPNPFNTETVILFDIAQRMQTTVKIYNLLGQEIITLIDGELNPGEKKIIWRGIDCLGQKVASGLYFCWMQAGSESRIRKMILVN